MQTQYSVLGYRIDLYFHGYKLPIETDEYGHSNKNIAYEVKRQKAINRSLVASLLELILTKNIFFRATTEIFRHIKQSIKKALIRVLWLEFKSDNTVKSKGMKHIAKNILPYC